MKWIFFVLIFSQGEPVNQLIVGKDTEAECKAEREVGEKMFKERGVAAWIGQCQQMQPPPDPRFKKEKDA